MGGATLAARTAAMLAACASPVVELGPGRSGVPAVPDAGGGPLAALAAAGTLWADLPDGGAVLVVATDLPRLSAGLLTWLGGHPAGGAVVPLDGAGRPQWLCARYPVAALRALAVTGPGDGRLSTWARSLHPTMAGPEVWLPAAGDPCALDDADDPDDLARLAGRTGPVTT